MAEAGVLVQLRAGPPQAAPADPEPPTQEPVPAGEANSAAQAAALPPRPRRRPRSHKELRPRPPQAVRRPRQAAPGLQTRCRCGGQAPPGPRVPR